MNYSEQGKLAILNKSKNNSASLRGSVIIFINALFIVGLISYFNRRALISHHYPKRDIATGVPTLNSGMHYTCVLSALFLML